MFHLCRALLRLYLLKGLPSSAENTHSNRFCHITLINQICIKILRVTLPKWRGKWIFLITAATGKHAQIWKNTLYWCTKLRGSGSLNSPGTTGRWDSLLFLWFPGIKVSFLLLKTYLNKAIQRNRLLISFPPLHVCINSDTLHQR